MLLLEDMSAHQERPTSVLSPKVEVEERQLARLALSEHPTHLCNLIFSISLHPKCNEFQCQNAPLTFQRLQWQSSFLDRPLCLIESGFSM